METPKGGQVGTHFKESFTFGTDDELKISYVSDIERDGPPLRYALEAVMAVCARLVKRRAFHVIVDLLLFLNYLLFLLAPRISTGSVFVPVASVILLILFTVEVFIKCLGKGKDFFLQTWNMLDLTIIAASWVFSFWREFGFQAFRTFNLCVYLNYMPGIGTYYQIALRTLLEAIPLLQLSVTCFVFFISVYSLSGREFFANSFSRQCLNAAGQSLQPKKGCKVSEIPWLDKSVCPEGFSCQFDRSIRPEYLHFDTLPNSMFVAIRVVSLSDWANIMYFLQGSENLYGVAAWFVLLVYLIPIVVVNLFIAVIVNVYKSLYREAGLDRDPLTTEITEAVLADFKTLGDHIVKSPASSRRASVSSYKAMSQYAQTMVAQSMVPPLEEMVQKRPVKEPVKQPRKIYVVAGEAFIQLCVSLNYVFLMFEHYNQPNWVTDLLTVSEIVFLGIFSVECIVKLFYYGPKKYFRSWGCMVDLFVVAASIPSLFLDSTNLNSPNVSLLRSLRVLRLVRVVRALKEVRRIMLRARKALAAASAVYLVITVVILVFATLGTVFYAGRLGPEHRMLFDTYQQSMLTLYIILTSEAWTIPMMEAMDRIGVWHCVYFLSFWMLNSWFLLSLFAAVVVNVFSLSNSEIRGIAEKTRSPVAQLWLRLNAGIGVPTRAKLWAAVEDVVGLRAALADQAQRTRQKVDYHLYLFRADGKIVTTCKAIVTHKVFEVTFFLLIVASSLSMAWDPPAEADLDIEYDTSVGDAVNILFLVVFSIEAVLKIIAQGLFFTEKAYLKSAWDRLDFSIVFSMYLTLALGFFGFLRLMRSFRPLRLLNRVETLRLVASALWSSLPAISEVLVFYCFLVLMFATIGLNLFVGKLGFCTDPTAQGRSDCVGTQVVNGDQGMPYVVPVSWRFPRSNFNNIGDSILTLVEVASLSDWTKIMYSTMDISGFEKQPVQGYSWGYSLFFIIFTAIGNLFLINFFIGIISEHLNLQRGALFLTSEQQSWVEFRRILLIVRPKAPMTMALKGSLKEKCQKIAWNRSFGRFVTIVTIINVIIDFTWTANAPSYHLTILLVVDFVCSLIYVFDVSVRGFAVDFFTFLRESFWNVFDVFFAVGLFVTASLTVFGVENFYLLQAAKVFRICRLVKMVTKFTGLMQTVDTLIVSAPSILNISFMLIITFIVYAYTARSLMANIRFQTFYNERVNFREFHKCVFVLMQSLTLDGWNQIMHDVSTTLPFCTVNPQFDDCGWPTGSRIYFVSFYVISYYVILNLVIAIIMDNFNITVERNRATDLHNPEDLEMFKDMWLKYDPHLTAQINRFDLEDMIRALGVANCSLGFDPSGDADERMRFHLILYTLRKSRREAHEKEKLKIEKKAKSSRPLGIVSRFKSTKTARESVNLLRFKFSDVLQAVVLFTTPPHFLEGNEQIKRATLEIHAGREESAKIVRGFLEVMERKRLGITSAFADMFSKANNSKTTEKEQPEPLPPVNHPNYIGDTKPLTVDVDVVLSPKSRGLQSGSPSPTGSTRYGDSEVRMPVPGGILKHPGSPKPLTRMNSNLKTHFSPHPRVQLDTVPLNSNGEVYGPMVVASAELRTERAEEALNMANEKIEATEARLPLPTYLPPSMTQPLRVPHERSPSKKMANGTSDRKLMSISSRRGPRTTLAPPSELMAGSLAFPSHPLTTSPTTSTSTSSEEKKLTGPPVRLKLFYP